MKSLLLMLALVLALIPHGSVAQTDGAESYMEFLTHVQDATSLLPEDGAGIQSFAEGELEWALANPPEPCYADTWGRYLILMERSRSVGWALDSLDTDASTFFMSDFEDLTDGIAVSIAESTTECTL